MHKEKREKPTQIYVLFPEGIHEIRFGPSEGNDTMRILGHINLISILTDDEITYVGAIHFHHDLKEVGNDPYPLTVTFNPEDGAIHFMFRERPGSSTSLWTPISISCSMEYVRGPLMG